MTRDEEDILQRPIPVDGNEAQHLKLRIRRRLPGRRLDKYLHSRVPRLSRTAVQRLIKQGDVTVNGQPTKSSYELDSGDIVELIIPPPEPREVLPQDIPLDVVFEDDYLMAINKATGIICHPARATQTGTIANAVAFHANQLSHGEDPFRPGIVHRLDKNTTGIMLIAKTDETHWRLSLQFDGGTIDRRALGGSETALIQAARALAERGNRVTVINNCGSEGAYHGVLYIPVAGLARACPPEGFDVLIVSRQFGFFELPLPAKLKVLWNHDTLGNPNLLRALERRIDLFLVLSRFHRDHYLTLLPGIEGRVVITRNGVDVDLLDRAAAGTRRDPDRAIYASRPERGLLPLLTDIWPELLRRRPGLRLGICSYQVDRAGLPADLRALYDRIDRLMVETPGIVNLGALAKADYYRHLAGSALMLYPCSFPEISCIAALEAQVVGTPILTTDDFALTETVRDPRLRVPGRPGQPAYTREYVRRALELLESPKESATLGAALRQAVIRDYTWPAIVAVWERLFRLNLAARRGRERTPHAGTA